ncbi:tryptophan--tRNA ligase [bacterium]|nr:tryptophan--tRNA ligase [bacterium]
MVKKRILSGMRPSGRLHLGHAEGVLSNWVKLQDEYECYYEVADFHSLTTDYQNTSGLKNNIKEMVIDWLSCGLDPDKCCMFVQSDVSEHAQLHLLLSMIVPLSWLERCPTYKEQLQQLKDRDISTYGFLGYPVLQAADILLYRADAVPVGEDQLPHLELSREIVRRFNFIYKPKAQIFLEPSALLTHCPKLPGMDGRKMSKSYNNCIYISDSAEVITKKIKQMITDPARIKVNDPGHPDVCSVYGLHKVYTSSSEVKNLTGQCKEGEIGCVACKKNLIQTLLTKMEPIHKKRKEVEKYPIQSILRKAGERAREVACSTMGEVRKTMGI